MLLCKVLIVALSRSTSSLWASSLDDAACLNFDCSSSSARFDLLVQHGSRFHQLVVVALLRHCFGSTVKLSEAVRLVLGCQAAVVLAGFQALHWFRCSSASIC